MTRVSASITAMLCFALLPSAFADFPVRQGSNKETTPVVAYNSTNHEYLAVWAEQFMFGATTATSLKGRMVAEDGTMLGDPFTISTFTAYPAIAYNPHVNEFVVAGNSYGNIVGQRVSGTGTLVGSQTTLMSGASLARIVCNSISGQYLLVGMVAATGAEMFYSSRISADLQTVSPPRLLRSWSTGGTAKAMAAATIEEEISIGVAYAPIQSTETPDGRYLLVLGPGVEIRMLDSDGAVMNVVYDSQTGLRYPELPFRRGPYEGGDIHVDVAYGMGALEGFSGPAFLIVWSDRYNEWGGKAWSGIWGGYVDAAKLEYLASDPVYDRAFPISSVPVDEKVDSVVAQWRPRVSYNPSSEKFLTVWRETPKDVWNVKARKTHIRGSNGLGAAAGTNVVISDTVGFENPRYPAVAASTTSENALVIWQDSRDSASTKADIYGDVLKVGDAVIVPSTGTTVTNTNDQGPGSLRQAILNANASAGTDTITFNIPSSGPHTILPASPLPALTEPVVIDGYTQPGSSPNTNDITEADNAVHKIVIDGSSVPSAGSLVDGLCLRGGNSIVRGLVINSFTGAAVVCEGYGVNVIEGNYLGTDASGLVARPCFHDVEIRNVADNLVGGITPDARNIISGFRSLGGIGGNGIRIEGSGAARNHIRGNFVGLASDGNTSLQSDGYGVYMYNAPDNSVGGLQKRMRNVISGIGSPSVVEGFGVFFLGESAVGNVTLGNFIGTNAGGNSVVWNNGGILVVSPGATIGGAHPGAGNLISGSRFVGVSVSRDDAVVQGNFIGTDYAGTRNLGNEKGIEILGARNFTIGGKETGSGNVISGNTRCGVLIVAGEEPCSGTIKGNLIGVQADGMSALGNGGPGVLCEGGHSGYVIGGRESGEGNTIAFNDSEGVLVRHVGYFNYTGPVGVRISGNSIFSNKRIGINLAGGSEDAHGSTANDPLDADTGSNMLQNCPVVSSAEGGDFLSVQASLSSTPNTEFAIELFATPAGNPPPPGEGKIFLGFTSVKTDAAGNVSFSTTIGTPVPAGQFITMTATDPSGNTSEFSAPAVVLPGSVLDEVTNVLDSGPGSLRQAILNANARPGSDFIRFNIPGEGPHTIRPSSPLPAITDELNIDGYTQPGSSVNTNPFARGTNAVLAIELDGSDAGTEMPGLRIDAPDCTVRGLAINRFKNAGIALDLMGTVKGCFIGTDVSGLLRMGNGAGILISGDFLHVDNMIGGMNPEDRNVISGNEIAGIIVGDTVAAAEHNKVLGNYIGTDATGAAPLGNTYFGIALVNGSANCVGDTLEGARNVISSCGNNGHDGSPVVRGAGIFIGRAFNYDVVRGNLIGLNAAGDAALDNYMDGILLRQGGGCLPATLEYNVISGNAFSGVWAEDFGGQIWVSSNLIGTDITGSHPIGNQAGITINGGDGILIAPGGSQPNTIANNLTDGIVVCGSSYSVLISGNAIYGNGGLGINLVGGTEDGRGWTANDPGDSDTGPNGLQNYPDLIAAEGGEYLTITGSLQSLPDSTYILEFFTTHPGSTPGGGEGKEFLGQIEVRTDANGFVSFNVTFGKPVPEGELITATATAGGWSTSEFSAPIVVMPGVTSVARNEALPRETALTQNFPNPFNPATTIRFTIAGVAALSGSEGRANKVRLAVYDLLGREVAVLLDEQKAPGRYQVEFDGAKLSSGVYIYRLTAENFVESRRMMLIK
jgi:hypothetical protein